MKVLTGHLTATNKKHIKAILAAGLTEGKINRITYYLTRLEGVYVVEYRQNDRGLGFIGSELRESTYKATFTA